MHAGHGQSLSGPFGDSETRCIQYPGPADPSSDDLFLALAHGMGKKSGGGSGPGGGSGGGGGGGKTAAKAAKKAKAAAKVERKETKKAGKERAKDKRADDDDLEAILDQVSVPVARADGEAQLAQ
jgi:hypothetical protein